MLLENNFIIAIILSKKLCPDEKQEYFDIARFGIE